MLLCSAAVADYLYCVVCGLQPTGMVTLLLTMRHASCGRLRALVGCRGTGCHSFWPLTCNLPSPQCQVPNAVSHTTCWSCAPPLPKKARTGTCHACIWLLPNLSAGIVHAQVHCLILFHTCCCCRHVNRRVLGVWKQHATLTQLVIRNTGHMVRILPGSSMAGSDTVPPSPKTLAWAMDNKHDDIATLSMPCCQRTAGRSDVY